MCALFMKEKVLMLAKQISGLGTCVPYVPFRTCVPYVPFRTYVTYMLFLKTNGVRTVWYCVPTTRIRAMKIVPWALML
jgi:hypothetical protein